MRDFPYMPRSMWTAPATNREACHARRTWRRNQRQQRQTAEFMAALDRQMDQTMERFKERMKGLLPEDEALTTDNEPYVN